MSIRFFSLVPLLIICYMCISCEEVIDIDLPTSDPKLVVEANLDYNFQDYSQPWVIKLSLTTEYFSKNIPPANGAIVWIEDANKNTYPFSEVEHSGFYVASLAPDITDGQELILHIEYDNEKYEAKEQFYKLDTEITLSQSKTNYFNKSFYEVQISYHDSQLDYENPERHYYLTEQQRNSGSYSWTVQNNEFREGNVLTSTYISEDAQIGDTIHFNLYKISKNYYNFIYKMSSSVNNGGGPFQIPNSTVKGNVRNITNPKNSALGYFRITEQKSASHIIHPEQDE